MAQAKSTGGSRKAGDATTKNPVVKATAKKAPVKAVSKKVAAVKAPTKKVAAATNAPTKKVPAKKVPAKKVPAKKVAPKSPAVEAKQAAKAAKVASGTGIDLDLNIDLNIDPEACVVDEDAAGDAGSDELDDFDDVDDVEPDDDMSVEIDPAAAEAGIVLVPLTGEDDEDDDSTVDDDRESDLGEDLATRLNASSPNAGPDQDGEDEPQPAAKKRRNAKVVPDDDEDDDDEPLNLRPLQSHEFTCSSCFLIKNRAQLTDPDAGTCNDCS